MTTCENVMYMIGKECKVFIIECCQPLPDTTDKTIINLLTTHNYKRFWYLKSNERLIFEIPHTFPFIGTISEKLILKDKNRLATFTLDDRYLLIKKPHLAQLNALVKKRQQDCFTMFQKRFNENKDTCYYFANSYTPSGNTIQEFLIQNMQFEEVVVKLDKIHIGEECVLDLRIVDVIKAQESFRHANINIDKIISVSVHWSQLAEVLETSDNNNILFTNHPDSTYGPYGFQKYCGDCWSLFTPLQTMYDLCNMRPKIVITNDGLEIKDTYITRKKIFLIEDATMTTDEVNILLDQNKSISTLRLRDCHLTDDAFEHFYIPEHLKCLDLSCNPDLTENSIKTLQTWMDKNKDLEFINLSNRLFINYTLKLIEYAHTVPEFTGWNKLIFYDKIYWKHIIQSDEFKKLETIMNAHYSTWRETQDRYIKLFVD